MKFESGGRNIHQNVVPAGGGFNPSTGTVTGPSSAQGYFQMITPTWQKAAKMAGIDTSQFPTAMAAPYELQRKAASALFAKEGFAPWAPYNAGLRAHIAKNGGESAFVNDGTATAAADLPAPGASPVAMETGQDGFAVPELHPAMSGDTFNAITAGLDSQPLAPTFQSEGVSQPWMGTALPPQPAPAPPAVAQAAPPMPPPRPADLAVNPQADLPAPGAAPAIGQMPTAAPIIADPTKDNAGVLSGLVASEEQRKGLPSGAGITSPFAGIVQALGGGGLKAAPQAPAPAAAQPASPVERVAAALPPQTAGAPAASPAVASVAAALPQSSPAAALGVNPRVLAAATSPYVSEGTRKVAQIILEKQMKDADYNRPDAVTTRRLDIEGKGLANEKARRDMEGEGATALTPQERASYGIPDTLPAYKTRRGEIKFGPAGTTVNVDTKGAGKFAEKANEHQAKRYSDMASAADESVALRGDVETLSSLLEGIATGRGAEAKLGIAQMAKGLGLDTVSDWLTGGKINEMEAAQSIMDRLTPRMRVPGSGATSDMEMRTFRNAIPSLGKQPGGNAIIANTFRGMLDHQAAAGEIAGRALRGEIGQADADKAIRDLPSPFARFKEFQKAQEKQAEPPAGGFKEGQRASNGKQTLIFRNGQWVPE